MEIPPNILKELEEKKIRALLGEAEKRIEPNVQPMPVATPASAASSNIPPVSEAVAAAPEQVIIPPVQVIQDASLPLAPQTSLVPESLAVPPIIPVTQPVQPQPQAQIQTQEAPPVIPTVQFIQPQAQMQQSAPAKEKKSFFSGVSSIFRKKRSGAALTSVAVEEKPDLALPNLGIGPIGPIPATPLLEAEPHKPSNGEIFFSWLTKISIFLAVFLTPLFFFNSSDTLNLSKQLLLSVLSLAAVAGWVGETVSGGRVNWRGSVLVWPIALVALATVFSSFFSSSFWVSFLGDSGRYAFSGLSVLAYLIIFLTATQNFSRRDFNIAIGLWLGSVFMVSVYALAQFFGIYAIAADAYKVRTFNSIGSPFALGLFVLSSVPFILALLQDKLSKKIKILLGLAVAVQLAVAFIVDFNSGWIALAVSALVLILLAFKKQQIGPIGPIGPMQNKTLLPLSAIVLSLFMWFIAAPQIKDLTFQPEINPSYKASFDILGKSWREKLVFGSGLETYPYVYAKFKDTSLNQTNYWGVNFNDSTAEVITWATTTGFFGAVAWLVFIIGFLIYAWKKMGQMGERGETGLKSGILASWVFILVSKFLYPTSLSLELFFWFLPALFVLAHEQGVGPIGPIRPISGYRFQSGSVKTLAVFFVLLAVLLGTLAGEYFSIKRWGAEKDFVKAATASNAAEKRDEVLNGIYSAVVANPYEVRYFRVLSQALFAKMNDVVAGINARPPAERQPKKEETAQLQDLTARTVNSVQRAIALDPNNVSVAVDAAESFRSLVPLVQSSDDLAIQNYEKASALEPINPFIKTQLGQLYLIKSNLFDSNIAPSAVDKDSADKARNILDEALKLNSNYANARYFRALIQDKDGQKREALQSFKLLQQTNPDNKLIAEIVANLEQGLPALGNPPAPAIPPQSPKAVETKGMPRK